MAISSELVLTNGSITETELINEEGNAGYSRTIIIQFIQLFYKMCIFFAAVSPFVPSLTEPNLSSPKI